MKVKYGKISMAIMLAALLATAALPALAKENQSSGGQVGKSEQNEKNQDARQQGMHNGLWQNQGTSTAERRIWTGSSTMMMNPWRNGTSTNSMPSMAPGIFGTVSAVNGTMISVASRGFGQNTATTTYSVDASKALIYKNNANVYNEKATTTISSILVGDRIFVQGTVSGTSIAATIIHDGVMMGIGRPGIPGGQKEDDAQNHMPIMRGNGQPVVAGTVSTVSGTSLTITTSSNVSYSINAASTTISKNGVASTVSSIAVGDYIVVQGPISGNSVTASLIIDQVKSSPGNGKGNNGNGLGNGESDGNNNGKALGHMGVFGSIGNFFKNLFGF